MGCEAQELGALVFLATLLTRLNKTLEPPTWNAPGFHVPRYEALGRNGVIWRGSHDLICWLLVWHSVIWQNLQNSRFVEAIIFVIRSTDKSSK